MTQEVADPVDRQIRRTIRLRVASVLTLPGKDRGDALTPSFLDGGQDRWLVVYQAVVLRRVAALDVLQRLLLVDVDQDVAIHRLEDARTLDFSGLEDHISVREDDRRTPSAEPLQDVERPGV